MSSFFIFCQFTCKISGENTPRKNLGRKHSAASLKLLIFKLTFYFFFCILNQHPLALDPLWAAGESDFALINAKCNTTFTGARSAPGEIPCFTLKVMESL